MVLNVLYFIHFPQEHVKHFIVYRIGQITQIKVSRPVSMNLIRVLFLIKLRILFYRVYNMTNYVKIIIK